MASITAVLPQSLTTFKELATIEQQNKAHSPGLTTLVASRPAAHGGASCREAIRLTTGESSRLVFPMFQVAIRNTAERASISRSGWSVPNILDGPCFVNRLWKLMFG